MAVKPAEWIGKVKCFIQGDLWDIEPESLPKDRRCGLRFLQICILVVKGFKENRCPIHASSLTFTTVMAMVPFLVILFAIAKGFGFERISEMLLNQTAGMPPAFQEAVQTILDTVGSASTGALGGTGVIFFLWAAIKMLSSIEETFNIVWGIKTSRAFIDKVRNYIVIFVVVPILLICAQAGMPVIMGFAETLTWMGPYLGMALSLIPVIMMVIPFTVVYFIMPNTHVKLSSALMGAFIAALLTVLFQFAIIKLGVLAARTNATYGTLAAIPLFLSWVQVSWIILLLGAEVSFSVQNVGTYAQERLALNPSARSRLCLALALMKKITVAFNDGTGPFDTLAYGIAQRVPIRLIHDVIHILKQNGLIVEVADRSGCYTLRSTPTEITARMIVDAILNEGADPHELGMKDDFPMFGEITGDSFRFLEERRLTSF